jgi:hypothetical protein
VIARDEALLPWLTPRRRPLVRAAQTALHPAVHGPAQAARAARLRRRAARE